MDSCGAYKRFNASEHIPIECNSDESHMPGSFCMKVVQQGPRGFICKFVVADVVVLFASFVQCYLENMKTDEWQQENAFNCNWIHLFLTGDGRWRHVIRRCASVSDTGKFIRVYQASIRYFSPSDFDLSLIIHSLPLINRCDRCVQLGCL